jgi:nucleoid-associated protein YgaU
MALEKMKIKIEGPQPNSFNTTFEVMFNPNKLSIAATSNWSKAGTPNKNLQLQYTHPDTATLAVVFLFDVFEQNGDVRDKIDGIVKLSVPDPDLHRPPACQLFWGEWHVFIGVLTSLTQDFTLFFESGKPARASLNCRFSGWPQFPGEHHSADVAKTHIVRLGDTLSGIAQVHYNDPALWRPIASANRIVDPLSLPVGKVLLVPPLTALPSR